MPKIMPETARKMFFEQFATMPLAEKRGIIAGLQTICDVQQAGTKDQPKIDLAPDEQV